MEVICMIEENENYMRQSLCGSGLNIHSNLKVLRQQKGVTQKIVAKALNIETTTLSHYETGVRTPDIDTLIRLADYYETSVEKIIAYEI